MLKVYPDYYNEFECINKKCEHNCCIGWEIDIDEAMCEYYKTVKGDFGQRLKENISPLCGTHFILDKNERCPFLNDENLCDIIITLGEENICEICKEHPRFHNKLPGRTESGLGLCCEEAARILLGKKDAVKLVKEGEDGYFDETVAIRDSITKLLQNREKDIDDRIEDVFSFFSVARKKYDFEYFSNLLCRLERLDNRWTDVLDCLKQNIKTVNISGFKAYIKHRSYEYEQLLVYIIYRYFANSVDLQDMILNIRFADFVYKLIFLIGAVIFTVKGEFTFLMQTELVRMFSCEIEYSDENVGIIMDELERE